MNNTTFWQRLAVASAAAVLLSLSTAILAADGGDHLNVQGSPRPDYLPVKPDESFQLPPLEPSAGPSPAAESAASLKLDRVVFRGNTVFPTSELEAIASPYLRRSISLPELEELRQKLTRHYIDRGYVNSGVLLAKENAGDVAAFEVIEGRLTAIHLRGMERLNQDYVARRLAKDTDGPLNIDVLRERYQLLLGDPLIQRMNARLMPDARLGEAILDIDLVRARPYHLTAFVNNYRPPSIGSEAIGASGWVRNLTGYGDVLDASLQNSPRQGDSPRASLDWHVPINQKGTQLSLQFDHGRSSVVEEPMQTLDIKSTLDSRDIGLSQTLIETLAQKLTFGLNRVSRENKTWLLGVPYSFNPGEPNGVTKETLWRFWQEYSYRTETQVLALRSTFTSGRNNVQNIAGLPPTTLPQADYRIWLGQAQYARQVLDNGAQAIVRGTLQRTPHKLLALDGMAIGGISTVRGYRENQLIRDNGEILSFELDYPLIPGSSNGLSMAIIPFFDSGRGHNKDEAATKLCSLGLATRLQWQGFNLDLAIAKRLSSRDILKTNSSLLQDKGVHLQFSYNYWPS